jgi:hypothetical protein
MLKEEIESERLNRAFRARFDGFIATFIAVGARIPFRE